MNIKQCLKTTLHIVGLPLMQIYFDHHTKSPVIKAYIYAYLFGVVMYICITWLGCQTRGWTYPRTPVRIITVNSRNTEISKSALKSKAEGVYSYSTVNTHNLECPSTIRTNPQHGKCPVHSSFDLRQNAPFSVLAFHFFKVLNNIRMPNVASLFSKLSLQFQMQLECIIYASFIQFSFQI